MTLMQLIESLQPGEEITFRHHTGFSTTGPCVVIQFRSHSPKFATMRTSEIMTMLEEIRLAKFDILVENIEMVMHQVRSAKP